MRRLLVMTFAFATVLLAGCGSDGSTAPTQASLAGTWSLSTINGSPLPFVLQASGPKIEIMSDEFTVAANGTFTESTVARVTDGTTVSTITIPDNGTYTLNGTAAVFTFSDGSSGTGTVSGNTFTVASGGYSQVYTKR
jgi:ABC-type Fe3+-hydroxamate transport system substrate-binding protein